MTNAATEQAPTRIGGIDLSKPVLYGFALVLCLLIVLPMSWLVYYGFTDKDGAFTLQNFVTLVNDPTMLDPLMTTFTLAFSTSVICCVVAAPMGWLVARTDMPLRRTVRLMVTASFVTPPFLGAIAWELLAAPNSGLLNQFYRVVTGLPREEHLFNIYSFPGLIFVIACYTFPYVFVLVANALDRMPGDLEDASSILGARTWDTARRITIPLVLPAILAGALVAFLQAMTLFGSPAILAIPAGYHTMTTKIWSLFQYPPKPELAAAASLPLLVLTVLLLRAEHMILGRRSYSVIGGKNSDPRIIRLGWLRWVALGFSFVVLLNPVFLPYGALFNAAFSKVASQFIWFDNFTFQNIHFVFYELSATKLALYNTFVLGISTATIGTIIAVVIAYLTTREAVTGHRALGFLATAPVAIPGIVLGVGLFLSYTRPPFVLYGTLWILLAAFLTLSLPAAYQQMQSAYRAIHPELEDASRILGATRLRALWQITAPLLRTSVIATWCFVFVGTIRELSAAIMLFTSETKVVSVLIFDLNESGDLAAISVLGIIMLVVTFGIVALANRLRIGGGDIRIREQLMDAKLPDVAVAEKLAGPIAALDPGTLPAAMRARCEETLIDVIGLCLAARNEDYVRSTLQACDDDGRCTAIGHTRTLGTAGAALVNGTAAHGEDFDDTFEGGPVHAGAVIVPAVLAACERYGRHGADALAGMAVGIEVMCRLGLVAPKMVHKAGFHPTAVFGAMGAAAAVGRALRLDAGQITDAFGIAGSMASGIIEYLAEGTSTKRMHAGWAAQSGLRAALMARAGFSGPRTVFEGVHGFFHGFANTRPDEFGMLTDGFGTRFVAQALAFKLYPCGTMTHPYIDCARRLGARGIKADDVVEMVCDVGEGTVHRLWEPLAGKQTPKNGYAGKFSTPYCVAAGFIRGNVGLSDFTDAAVHEPAVVALAGKVGYRIDPANPYPNNFTGHIRATLRDGRVIEERQPYMRGGAHEPLSRADIEAKFLLNARHGGYDAARAEAALKAAAHMLKGPVDLSVLRG